MTEILSMLKDIIPQVVTILGTLIAVYLGWKLTSRSDARKRALEVLEKQLDALRQLKEVAQNIPSGVESKELADRMEHDQELRNALKHRLVRLFGLRIELLPHLEESTIRLIDEKFAPLFDSYTGRIELRQGVVQEFAKVCIDIVIHVDELESRLVKSYRRLTKK
jgi:hypothetical protein